MSADRRTPRSPLVAAFRVIAKAYGTAATMIEAPSKQADGARGHLGAAPNLPSPIDDAVSRFKEERVVPAPGQSVFARDLFNAFVVWSRANGIEEVTQAAFGRATRRNGFTRAPTAGPGTTARRRYLNVAIKPTDAGVSPAGPESER